MKIQPLKTWFGTIVMASILLALALMGGTWGTSYGAQPQEVMAAPVITSIDPMQVIAGSANLPLVIKGSNFGNISDTRVRFYQWGGGVFELVPLAVFSDTIFVEIPSILLVNPNLFDIVVVKYSTTPTVPTVPTIPTIPTDPTVPIIPVVPGEEISNQVTFRVYLLHLYLPIIFR